MLFESSDAILLDARDVVFVREADGGEELVERDRAFVIEAKKLKKTSAGSDRVRNWSYFCPSFGMSTLRRCSRSCAESESLTMGHWSHVPLGWAATNMSAKTVDWAASSPW